MMINEKNYHVNSFNNSTNNSSFENIKSKKSFINNSNKITPIQFGFNFYFDNIKSSPFTPINSPKNQYFKYNSNNQKNTISFIFKTSLEKSGYKINSDQAININEYFNEFNNKNSLGCLYDDNNYYSIPINNNYSLNNSGIINNIYPTITKVTNVQMVSDINKNNSKSKNLKDKDNYVKFNNKRENDNNNKSNINIIENKEKKEIINDTNQNNDKNEFKNRKIKIVFECSESDVNKNLISKKFIKKKRFRKNNEQIAFLSKFYKENKNWSKNEIKQMSKNIGLKENKIYKWLWDQKNKEYNKSNKFVINKNNN